MCKIVSFFCCRKSNLIKSMRAFIPISLCWSSVFMLEIGWWFSFDSRKKTKRIRRFFSFHSFTFSNSVVPFYANGWHIATPWLMFAVFQISFKLRIWKAIASNGKQSLALYLLPAPQYRSHFISSLSILCTHNGECGGNLCPHHIYHVSPLFRRSHFRFSNFLIPSMHSYTIHICKGLCHLLVFHRLLPSVYCVSIFILTTIFYEYTHIHTLKKRERGSGVGVVCQSDDYIQQPRHMA